MLGKEARRRVFGFQCSPPIQATIKSLVDQIHVPLFALAEHGLQLGAIQIEAAMSNPEELELLHHHLTEVHVEMKTIEKISRFDEEAANTLDKENFVASSSKTQ